MKLDLGCGNNKPNGYTGMDLKEADINHDMEETPCPIESNSCETVRAYHILEHIKPWKILSVMDEIWRIMKSEGILDIVVPTHWSYRVDPTHCLQWERDSFAYFDPLLFNYQVYWPKPWGILADYPKSEKYTLECKMMKLTIDRLSNIKGLDFEHLRRLHG